jgi:hypothetical protein
MGGVGSKKDDHPFKAGLGPLIDLRDPTIELIEPQSGEYISGTHKKFWGYAYDDYKVVSVHFKVTSEQKPGMELYKEYTKVERLDDLGNGKWYWEFYIDTTQFPQAPGVFKIRLKVTDSAGKTGGEENDYIFFIDNEPPEITVSSPRIESEKQSGDLPYNVGATKFNPGIEETIDPKPPYGRQKGKKNYLTGSINDEEGIYDGPASGDDLYPPQIRFWPIKLNKDSVGVHLPGNPPPSDPSAPGYNPEYGWKAFTELGLDADGIAKGILISSGSNNKSFSFGYLLPEDPGFYGFEIRAQTKSGRVAHYPQSYYPDDYFDYGANVLNSYVVIYVSPEQEVPKVDIYRLEDLIDHWNAGTAGYNPLPGVSDNEPPPYINAENNIYKRGPFTLRVKASHSSGIDSAAVYWEKVGTTERGRVSGTALTERRKTNISILQ